MVGAANTMPAAALAETAPMRALTRASTVFFGAAIAKPFLLNSRGEPSGEVVL
jgi:hypothetical protein